MDKIKKQISGVENAIDTLNKEHEVILDSLKKEMTTISQIISQQNEFQNKYRELLIEVANLKKQVAEIKEFDEKTTLPKEEDVSRDEIISSTETCEERTVTETIKASTTVSENVEQEEIVAENPLTEVTKTEATDIIKETTEVSKNEDANIEEPTTKETVKPQQQEELKNEKTETVYQSATTNSSQEKSNKTLFNIDKSDWEKFIGENLISKIGILIIMIGVAIGGKYAIDNQLISPTARIIIGTLIGFGLQGFALKLKKKYENFSAVLSSGALAILYFMVFFAYNFYSLIPMPVAFILMVVITACTIHSAWSYNKEIIAILGQIGAYVIPFLLSSGSGNIEILLGYIAIINIGILIVSAKNYWKIVLGLAFFASWTILAFSYRMTEITSAAQAWRWLGFMFLYFINFYAAFFLYKVRKCQFFKYFDISYILTNAFFFFGLGYNLMKNHADLTSYVELFAVFNALVHFAVAFVLRKKKIADDNLPTLLIGVSIIFTTLAFAICFTGHWITLFWILEGTLLFALGRTKKTFFYELLSYPVILLALISLMADWGNPNGTNFGPLNFLAEFFAKWKALWDANATPLAIKQETAPWLTTIAAILSGVAMMFLDNRYPCAPAATKEEKQISDIWSNILKYIVVGVVTASSLVHISTPWFILVWAIEAAVLFQIGNTKNSTFFKNSSFVVILLSIFSLFLLWMSTKLPSLANLKNSIIELGFSQIFVSSWLHHTITALIIIGALLFIIHQGKKTDGLNDKSLYFDTTILRYIWSFFYIITSILLVVKLKGVSAPIISLTIASLVLFFVFLKAKCKEYKIAFNTPIFITFPVLYIYCIIKEPNFDFILPTALFCCSLAAILFILIKRGQKEDIGIYIPLALIFAVYLFFLKFFWLLEPASDKEALTHINLTLCYSLGYFTLLAYMLNRYKVQKLNIVSTILLFVITTLCIQAFCTILPKFDEMTFKDIDKMDCTIRFVTGGYAVSAMILVASYTLYMLKKYNTIIHEACHDITFIIAILILGSVEINWHMTQMNAMAYSKIAMSIYWGILSLIIVYLGLIKNIKYLRITGIVIFATTLLKIFFIDLTHLSTFAKSIVFVAMGILLLVASFFYQKIAKQQENTLKKEEGNY